MKYVTLIETFDGKIHPSERHASGHLQVMAAVNLDTLLQVFSKCTTREELQDALIRCRDSIQAVLKASDDLARKPSDETREAAL